MIARFLGLLVRVLLESAIMCLIMGAFLLLLAYRTGRRLAVTKPDPFERLSGPLAAAIKLFPRETTDEGAGDASCPAPSEDVRA